MPIITRTLEHVRPQANGAVKVQERLVDAKGRDFYHAYAAASEAAATAEMNARDMTEQLKDADFADLLAWVKGKNPSSGFDLTGRDLTLLEGEELLLIWFAGRPGAEALSVAWWVEDLSPPSYTAISARAGFTAATGSEIQDRAIALLAAEPRFDLTFEPDA